MLHHATTNTHVRFLRAVVVLGVLLLILPEQVRSQHPAPVSPTVPEPNVSFLRPRLPVVIPGAVGVKQPGEKTEPAKGVDNGGRSKFPELSLGQCIALTLERNPGLRALQESQQATGVGLQGLNSVGRLGSLFSRDLAIRKEQANRGVRASAAYVQKKHNELVNDVTRLYYTVVYAHQQSLIAEDVVAQIELLVDVARKLLEAADQRGMTKAKLDLMKIGLSKARGLLEKARSGEERAYAGLRMLMAVQDGSFPFRVMDKELPVMKQQILLTQEQVVKEALCNRPELALLAAGADAFRLEVFAQGKVPFTRAVPTLASGADIHSSILPSGNRDPLQDYRPEPIAPEMPPQVVGSRAVRVERAMAFSRRADFAFEDTRNLLIFEAEYTFQVFELCRKNVEEGKRKFEVGKDLMDQTREAVDKDPKDYPREMIVQGYVQAMEAQSDYVESVFQYLLALAALERVTAGGVRPTFPNR